MYSIFIVYGGYISKTYLETQTNLTKEQFINELSKLFRILYETKDSIRDSKISILLDDNVESIEIKIRNRIPFLFRDLLKKVVEYNCYKTENDFIQKVEIYDYITEIAEHISKKFNNEDLRNNESL